MLLFCCILCLLLLFWIYLYRLWRRTNNNSYVQVENWLLHCWDMWNQQTSVLLLSFAASTVTFIIYVVISLSLNPPGRGRWPPTTESGSAVKRQFFSHHCHQVQINQGWYGLDLLNWESVCCDLTIQINMYLRIKQSGTTQWWAGNLELGQMPKGMQNIQGQQTNHRAIWLSQPCSPKVIFHSPSSSINKDLHLNDKDISLILWHLTKRQSDQYLYTTYKSLCPGHGNPLQSTVSNFYTSLHCFVAKCLIQMFKNMHGLK